MALISIAPVGAQEETNVKAVLDNLRAGLGFVRDTPQLRSLFLVFGCLLGEPNCGIGSRFAQRAPGSQFLVRFRHHDVTRTKPVRYRLSVAAVLYSAYSGEITPSKQHSRSTP
jgi:hypothetical protein